MFWEHRTKKDSVKYLQLSISMWHNCRSIGKYCRFMGHDAVIVNLEKYIGDYFRKSFIVVE